MRQLQIGEVFMTEAPLFQHPIQGLPQRMGIGLGVRQQDRKWRGIGRSDTSIGSDSRKARDEGLQWDEDEVEEQEDEEDDEDFIRRTTRLISNHACIGSRSGEG